MECRLVVVLIMKNKTLKRAVTAVVSFWSFFCCWLASKGKLKCTSRKIIKNLLLVGPEDFVCEFTEEDFFIGSEISGRFLPHERLFVEKRHLFFLFIFIFLGDFQKQQTQKDNQKVRWCQINENPLKVRLWNLSKPVKIKPLGFQMLKKKRPDKFFSLC